MLLVLGLLASVVLVSPTVIGSLGKTGLSSVLVTEDTKDPQGAGQYYAPSTEPNTGSGGGQYYAPDTGSGNYIYNTTSQPQTQFQPQTGQMPEKQFQELKPIMQPGQDSNSNWNMGGGQGMEGQGGGQNPSAQDCKNDVRDAARMEKELMQLIKGADKKGIDATDLIDQLATVQTVKEKLGSCESMTWDELQSSRETLMGNGGVQRSLDVSRCKDEYNRVKQDIERMKKDYDRNKKHLYETTDLASEKMQKEMINQLDRMQKMQAIAEKRLALMDKTNCKIWSGDEYSTEKDEWEELNSEGQDLSYEMNDFWNNYQEVQKTAWVGQMFNDVEKKIAQIYEREYSNLSKELKEKFDSLVKMAKELLNKGRSCEKENDTACIEEVQRNLGDVMMKGSQIFGSPDVDFKQLGYTDTMNKNFKTISNDMGYGEASKVIEYLLSLDPTLAEKITDPAMADKIFKIMGHVPEGMKSEYLTSVGNLKGVFDEAVTKFPELAQYKGEIVGKSYFGTALDVLINGLKDIRDGKMTVEDLIAKMTSLKEESKKAEVMLGVTKFKDATTDVWYYEAANDENFNIQGKTIGGETIFDASGQTTFAEMLRVLVDGLGIGKQEGTSSYGPANGTFAQGYYKAVEGKAVTFMEPNHKITRGEMARLMVELLGLPVGNGGTPFTDLAGNKYEGYVSTLYTEGIMKGDGGTGLVRPNDTINRAEAFTLAKNAIDDLQIYTISTPSPEVAPAETTTVNPQNTITNPPVEENTGGGQSIKIEVTPTSFMDMLKVIL